MAESNALVIPKRVTMQYDNALATMSQEDKDRYLSMASSITPTDIGSIQSFGTESNGVLTETSNRLIQANANNLGDEVRDLVTSLVVEMKGIDVGELNAESKVKRFMRNLPFGLGKKLVLSYDKVMAKHESISKSVNDIQDKMQATKLTAQKNNGELGELFESNYKYIVENRDNIIAAKVKLDDWKEQRAAMTEETHEKYEIQAMDDAIEELEKHISDMVTNVYTTMLNMTEIQMIQKGNRQLMRNADQITNTLLPVWQRTIATSLTLANQRSAAEAQKLVIDSANALIVAQANELEQNLVKIEEMTSAPILDIDAVTKATDSINRLSKELKRSKETARQKSREREAALDQLCQRLEEDGTFVIQAAVEDGKQKKAVGMTFEA